MSDEKSIQEEIADAMPPIPEDRPIEGGIRMTSDEQHTLNQNLDAMIHALLEKGYTPTDLHVVFSGFEHRLNAQQYDPHEYDRIALSLKLRETVKEWRDEQDHEVPDREIAEALRDLAKVHRENGRREFYKEQGRKEAEKDE
jgi:hypothetical protein